MRDPEALLRQLIAIPSINPAYRTARDPETWFGEAAMAHAVNGWLRDAGLDVQLDMVLDERPNVVARLRGQGARRRLIWEGHLDTVQVTGMTTPPFEPILRDGRLHGRGAVDDKGCLAAFMLALEELARDPAGLDITFVAAVDEEFNQQGILHYLRRGEHFDGGVAGEPTKLRIVSACKGCVRWDIDILGRAAHSSKPEDGVDAVAVGAALAVHLRSVFGPALAARSHPLVGRATLVCTMIQGGEGPNTIPAHCRLKFDRRTLPGEANQKAWDEIAAEVRAFAGTAAAAGTMITVQPQFIDCPSMAVDETSAIVAAARAACRAFGLDDAVTGVPFGSDACQMTPGGIPTIVFGPGNIEQAHTADEYVEIAQVNEAANVLCELARQFAAGGP
jgi:succinyl-diaminopimelate desuccinylase